MIAHEREENGLFSAEAVRKWPDLTERVAAFAELGGHIPSANGLKARGSRAYLKKFPETPSRRLFRHFSVKNPLALSPLPFSDTP